MFPLSFKVMFALSVLVNIGTLVLFIIVLVKLFKREGVGLGILGIICGLYTFIWGWWLNHKEPEFTGESEFTGIMIVWSILIVISIFLNFGIFLIWFGAQEF